jgi:tripartite-type tricarboxylate transporter receptor subunit TctC
MLGSAISAGPNVKAGKLRAIAVSSPQRSQAYPDLPTVSESGVPGFDVSGSHSLFAPSGTAPAIVLAINKEVNQIVQQPEIKARLAALGAETVPPNTPAQFTQTLEAEVAKWAKFFKERPDVMSE